jgi:hypothetical protein
MVTMNHCADEDQLEVISLNSIQFYVTNYVQQNSFRGTKRDPYAKMVTAFHLTLKGLVKSESNSGYGIYSMGHSTLVSNPI